MQRQVSHISQSSEDDQRHPNNLLTSVQYNIIENFYNENFNMVYVKERSEEEIKLR